MCDGARRKLGMVIPGRHLHQAWGWSLVLLVNPLRRATREKVSLPLVFDQNLLHVEGSSLVCTREDFEVPGKVRIELV